MCLFTAQEFGLFLSDEDPKKGVWLESARTLEYYLLRNGVCFNSWSLLELRCTNFYNNNNTTTILRLYCSSTCVSRHCVN